MPSVPMSALRLPVPVPQICCMTCIAWFWGTECAMAVSRHLVPRQGRILQMLAAQSRCPQTLQLATCRQPLMLCRPELATLQMWLPMPSNQKLFWSAYCLKLIRGQQVEPSLACSSWPQSRPSLREQLWALSCLRTLKVAPPGPSAVKQPPRLAAQPPSQQLSQQSPLAGRPLSSSWGSPCCCCHYSTLPYPPRPPWRLPHQGQGQQAPSRRERRCTSRDRAMRWRRL